MFNFAWHLMTPSLFMDITRSSHLQRWTFDPTYNGIGLKGVKLVKRSSIYSPSLLNIFSFHPNLHTSPLRKVCWRMCRYSLFSYLAWLNVIVHTKERFRDLNGSNVKYASKYAGQICAWDYLGSLGMSIPP